MTLTSFLQRFDYLYMCIEVVLMRTDEGKVVGCNCSRTRMVSWVGASCVGGWVRCPLYMRH